MPSEKVRDAESAVPESEMRELEQEALSPFVDIILIDRENDNFWYKNIDEVISHYHVIELKSRGRFLR